MTINNCRWRRKPRRVRRRDKQPKPPTGFIFENKSDKMCETDSDFMSSTAGTAPPVVVIGLDVGGPWHRRAAEKSGSLVRTRSGSVHLQPAAGGDARTPLRLPSLGAAARGTRADRLSLSEPSLLLSKEKAERFAASCRSAVLPPPAAASRGSSDPTTNETFAPSDHSPPCLTLQHQLQSYNRTAYTRLFLAIQPSSKPPAPLRRHSHSPGLSAEPAQADLRPLAVRYRSASSCPRGELLSVIGKSCLPSGARRPAGPVGSARTQLHVFLPGEGEEADSDSVDEGFMDELDNKVSCAKLRRAAPKTVSQCARVSKEKCT